jgi:type IV secretion system protein VirB8
MNKPPREDLDAYYREAASWGADLEAHLRGSRRIAWMVAAAMMLIAILEAVALVVMMPLKSVEPYTLLVDRQTGFVEALNPLDPRRISGDAALTQSFLVQYVIAREGYDSDTLQTDYRKVALWSAESARSSYLAAMQASNPQSPLVLYPRTATIGVRVKSVSPVGRNVAMVRFETRRHDAGGREGPRSAWVALVRYRYSGEPMRLEDRFINPLGFQVVRYRRDAEALPVDADTPIETQAPAVQAVLPQPGAPEPLE